MWKKRRFASSLFCHEAVADTWAKIWGGGVDTLADKPGDGKGKEVHTVKKSNQKVTKNIDKYHILIGGLLQPPTSTPVRMGALFKGDLRTICRFSYMKVYKLITLGTKFKTLLSLGRKITMFSKFITNYIEQGWWHSSLTLKCMHLLLKEVNKRGRHAYNLHGWTCLPSGIVMEIHCHITGSFEAAILLFSIIVHDFPKYCYSCLLPK